MRALGGRQRARLAALPVVAAFLVLLPGGASAAVFGDGFSFAPRDAAGSFAPAFPDNATPEDPEDRAFWAGVCDLHAVDPEVGPLPALPFANCIDHPAAGPAFGDDLQPPLTPGLHIPGFPDGWVRSTGEIGGPSWRLADEEKAGGHPDGSASFWFSRGASGGGFTGGAFGVPDGAPRAVRVSLPAGVLANPQAVPQCPAVALANAPSSCPPKAQVGVATLSLDESVATYPVYNVEPRDGKTAELSISGAGIDEAYIVNQPIVAGLRPDDLGADGITENISAAAPFLGATITLWGVPWAAVHDRYRPVQEYCNGPIAGTDFFGGNSTVSAGMPVFGLPGGSRFGCSQKPVSYDPSWGPIKPFFATQTECALQRPVTRIEAANWNTSTVARAKSDAPFITGCEAITFPASMAIDPTSRRTDSPSGVEVELKIPQNNDPPASVRFDPDDATGAPAYWKSVAGRAVSHLDDTVVTLPEGFSINPSAATGQQACSSRQIGLTSVNPIAFDADDPADGVGEDCPEAAKLGTVQVETPLLAQEDWPTGDVYLASQNDNPFKSTYAIYIVVRSSNRGVVVKLAGHVEADGKTGRIKTTVKDNPQLPFDRFKLRFKAGPRAPLATPMKCDGGANQYRAVTSMAPWSRSHLPAGSGPGTQDPVVTSHDWPVDEGCAFGFAPSVAAGMDEERAARHGRFSFEFTRPQGDQWVNGLTAKLPRGLLAVVKDVPLCSNALADKGECPAASKIGTVDASAGSGDPFVLQEKGELFLTEGYKGGPYGLAVKVRAVAGPYDLGTIIVRQKVEVDPRTARVTAISDPFPTIWEGIPLRVRRVLVHVDRSNFMLNPTGCAAKPLDTTLLSSEGASAERTNGFQVRGCAALPFEPNLGLRLTGKRQTRTGRHPGIRAQVNQTGIGEAGIERAEVRLPKSLALDVDNAQALCEFEDGTKDDLENHCPKGSIVGRARAVSPLLNDPLAGNVYFVKNIRRDPKTGNVIRTLPMIIAALRGEIAINLVGTSDVKGGKLVSTFDEVPDAPVERFNLNINGGRNGILAVTRTRRSRINLCSKPKSHVAEADFDGHNGKRHDRNIRMKTPCSKRQVKNAKRAAKRAAKARNANR